MHDRHNDRELYFREQAYTTKKYVIPFIDSVLPVTGQTSVLEIGCGEGGNLLPFIEAGCVRVTGIDVSENKIENARKFIRSVAAGSGAEFICSDIYEAGSVGTFDLVMMRDVLEHIPDQEKLIGLLRRFLNPGGVVFIAFPPWHNPFGGHQQMCDSMILSRLPWIHLLPRSLYRGLLRAGGESDAKIRGLLEIKDTGISLGRFENAIKKEGFVTLKKSLWFINPNFEVKFGLRPRRLPEFLGYIPCAREFLVTTGYYIISMPHPGL